MSTNSGNLTVFHSIWFQISFLTLENLMSVIEGKNAGGMGKDGSLMSSFPWKSSCKRIICQTVKYKGCCQFPIRRKIHTGE